MIFDSDFLGIFNYNFVIKLILFQAEINIFAAISGLGYSIMFSWHKQGGGILAREVSLYLEVPTKKQSSRGVKLR